MVGEVYNYVVVEIWLYREIRAFFLGGEVRS